MKLATVIIPKSPPSQNLIKQDRCPLAASDEFIQGKNQLARCRKYTLPK